MKGFSSALLLSLASLAASANLSPISRCVQLLQNLGKQIEREAKQEEGMFEEYICWGKTVVDTKTASNSAGESRIDMLKQYLADIDAGRVEFTSERQDLEKEIAELSADLEQAKAMRTQENKDFSVAEEDMKKATTALKSAIEVLNKATKDHKGALVAVKTSVNQGFAERAAEGASLSQAVELGKKFLSKGDAAFLQRLLSGEVPKADWKKLNRKATFKMKYKERSTKIQATLKKLLQTFQSNLDDATSKEADSKKSYDKLKGTKEGQLDKSEKSLAKMEKEMGAKGMSKADAEKEVSDLETQVKNDVKFIADTTSSMATKTTEWKARKELRAGELAAISQALSILASDTAKDNFKKSASSQGFFFLQMTQKSAQAASKQIEAIARVTKDQRLTSMLANLQGGHFDAVITAIDKMVVSLKEAEAKDLSTKQDCEKDRMGDTRDALTAGVAIDDMTDSIASLTAEIKDLNSELDATNAELKDARAEIAAAKKIRKEEKAEWTTSDAEDQEASETVGMAVDTLEKFYKDNKLFLIQQAPAGDAPVPPPATWGGSYGGKKGESAGIIGILKLCQEDIDKDRTSAKADEDESQGAFDKAFAAFETQEKDLLKTIGSLEGQIGEREKKVETTIKSRGTKKGELDATLKKISNANPGCDYIEVNYPVRVKNRQVEVDGLLKARAILKGAAFAKPADENREIAPGDALLQLARRH